MVLNMDGGAVEGGASSSSFHGSPLDSPSSPSSSTQAKAQAQGASEHTQVVVPGRSCRGCLFFSRSLQDSGKEPVCWGLSYPETLPASSFRHPNQIPSDMNRPRSQFQARHHLHQKQQQELEQRKQQWKQEQQKQQQKLEQLKQQWEQEQQQLQQLLKEHQQALQENLQAQQWLQQHLQQQLQQLQPQQDPPQMLPPPPKQQQQQQQQDEKQQQQQQLLQQQQQQQQQQRDMLEKHHKTLEDFRYACIGYSLYRTTIPPSSSTRGSSPAASTHSRQHPPPESSSSFSSASGPHPVLGRLSRADEHEAEVEHPLPLPRPMLGPTPVLAWAAATCASQMHSAAMPAAVGAPAVDHGSTGPVIPSTSDSTSSGSSCPGSSHGRGSGRSSGCPADAEGAAAGVGPERSKKAQASAPMLPLCVGFEIFAATKAEQERQHTQGEEQHKQQEQHQGEASGAGWSLPTRTPGPNAAGVTAEEFARSCCIFKVTRLFWLAIWGACGMLLPHGLLFPDTTETQGVIAWSNTPSH